MTAHLSPRQWRLLQLLARRAITEDESYFVYQGTLGSFTRKTLTHGKLIDRNNDGGFTLTEHGRELLHRYNTEELMKSAPSRELSKWLRVHRVLRARKAS